MIFVTYAVQNGDDELDGAHLGAVDAYAMDGALIARPGVLGSGLEKALVKLKLALSAFG